MSEAALRFLAELVQGLGIPYAFMEWEMKPPDDYYFVGEYMDNPSTTREESGLTESTFILRGFTRQSWLHLEQAKAKIEKSVGQTAIFDNGSGIAIFYDSAQPVPTGDAELKSIKINLTIQERKVN